MLYGLIAVTLALFVVLGLHEWERSAWQTERGKLLDRIQASSLAEYKHFAADETPEDDIEDRESETELV